MLRKIIHIIVWILVFAYLGVALAFTNKREREERIGGISVHIMDSSEYQFISHDYVVKKLGQFGFRITDMSIDSVSRNNICEVVKDFDAVKDANVFFTPDNKLNIKIWQRRPVLRVLSGRNDYFIDETRKPFQIPPIVSPTVLVFTGEIDEVFAAEVLYDLANYVRENEFFNSLIQEIHVDEKKNIELIPRVGKQRIFLGSPDNYEWKFIKLKTFYSKAMPELGWERYKTIDLSFGDQVVCKRTDFNSVNE